MFASSTIDSIYKEDVNDASEEECRELSLADEMLKLVREIHPLDYSLPKPHQLVSKRRI